eukprot:15783751-Heterocapsa_arctica.AAC.1
MAQGPPEQMNVDLSVWGHFCSSNIYDSPRGGHCFNRFRACQVEVPYHVAFGGHECLRATGSP